MQEFNISYTYAKADGTSRTQTTQKVRAESESAAKKIIQKNHESKGQIVVQWRWFYFLILR